MSRIQNDYDERLKDITGSGWTSKIKEAMAELKVSALRVEIIFRLKLRRAVSVRVS